MLNVLKPEEVNTKKIKERDNNYISPKQFMADLADYYELSEKVEQLDPEDKSKEAKQIRFKCKKAFDKCGLSIYKLVIGLSNKGNFSGYTWKGDMIGDALVKCNKALVGKKYKFSRKYNPFSYYNRIAWREFIHRIEIEKKKHAILEKYRAEHYYDFGHGDESEGKVYVKPLFMENFGDFYNPENEIHHDDSDD